jgi:hypothetical protein
VTVGVTCTRRVHIAETCTRKRRIRAYSDAMLRNDKHLRPSASPQHQSPHFPKAAHSRIPDRAAPRSGCPLQGCPKQDRRACSPPAIPATSFRTPCEESLPAQPTSAHGSLLCFGNDKHPRPSASRQHQFPKPNSRISKNQTISRMRKLPHSGNFPAARSV